MKKLLILSGLLTAAAISLVSSTEALKQSFRPHVSSTYTWQQLAPAGSGTHQHEWKPGTYPSAIVPVKGPNGRLWMIGQKRSWSSKDGVTWEAFEKHDWGERISMNTVFFKDQFIVSGGMDYSTIHFTNEVWTSHDGLSWKKNRKHAEWSPRKGHTMVEFKNKLWLFGGETGVDKDRVPDKFINDVWASEDGQSWVKIMDEAPWKVRGHPRVIVFQDKLWLIGGQGISDVWNSSDGKAWTKITGALPWGNRYDFGLLTFDDRLWLLGGRDENPRNAYQDVWFSADGIHWQLQTSKAPWTKRSGNFSVVFNNKLFMYGGKHTGHDDSFSGDIWALISNH